MDRLLLLKDVAQISGQSIHTVKYYLKIGLLKEAGRSSETRFRYFDEFSLQRLTRIRSLRKQNKSIKEIQEILSNELL